MLQIKKIIANIQEYKVCAFMKKLEGMKLRILDVFRKPTGQ